jgi:hypothetical protein
VAGVGKKKCNVICDVICECVIVDFVLQVLSFTLSPAERDAN